MEKASKPKRFIRGFLIDIDGVLYIENQRLPGALEAIQYLNENNIPYLLCTNTSRRSRYSLLSNLHRMGFQVDLETIFPAPYAAARWLKSQEVQTIYLLLRGDAYREFTDFKVTANKPDYLVIGDIGEDLTFDKLNHAFRLVIGGTRMLALQKNRFWQRKDGLAMDAGAIVAALEYATRKRARVIGKPSRDFFVQALKQLGLAANEVAVIGDDLETDIRGGARVGMFTIAVQTGKFRAEDLPTARAKPDWILPSIAELPEWIEKLPKEEGIS